MKITGVKATRVFLPWQDSLKEPMRKWRTMGGTTPEEEDAYVIIQVRTDEGIVGVAIPNACLPYDTLLFLREAFITKEGYSHSIKDGHLPVPEGPGLGIVLDPKACERYRVA